MAGGMEWSRSVQPLLTTSHSLLDKNDIPEIVKTIVKRYIIEDCDCKIIRFLKLVLNLVSLSLSKSNFELYRDDLCLVWRRFGEGRSPSVVIAFPFLFISNR
jgi:hypothetical protein